LLPLLERLKITYRQLLAKLNGKTEVAPTPKLSPKYAGKLPVKVSEAMQKHIAESRSEWEHNI